MSLETVAEDIRNKARERADAIRSDAQSQAEEIIAEAEEDADTIAAEKESAVEERIASERDQQLSNATLEAKQGRLEVRRDLLAEVRSDVESHVAGLEDDTREELTRTLLDDATVEFDADGEHGVYGRASDESLLIDILEEYDSYEYAGEYDCLGGVVVEDESSRIRVNNTFDSVIERVWKDNLQEISSRLFAQ